MSLWSTAFSWLLGGKSRLALILGGLLLLGIATGLAAWRGYSAGYDKAAALGRADLLEQQNHYAVAMADAQRQAREMLEAEVARATEIEADYLDAQAELAARTRELTDRRIADASRDVVFADGMCLHGPAWMRVYNEAIGVRGDGDSGQSYAAPGTAGSPEPGAPADAWLRYRTGTVTDEDVLAHLKYYGHRCQEIELQLNKLIDWAEGTP